MKWLKVKLGEIAKIVGGSTPRRENKVFWDGNIAWVTPTDLSMPGQRIDLVNETSSYITEKGLSSCSTQILPVGTVLFSSRATIGKIGIAQVPLTTNQGFANFIPKNIIDSKFLAYVLMFSAKNIENLAGSTTFKEVTKTSIRKYEIPLPPPTEQRRIVEILDQADELRLKRAEGDQKAERILPALFLKMFGDPTTNPKGWKIVNLGNVAAEFRYGTSVKCESNGQGLPVLRIPNIVKGELDLTDLKFAELNLNEIKTLKLIHDDVLFVRTNGNPEYVGRCSVFDGNETMLFASYLIRARLNTNEINSWYLTSYLQTSSGRQAMSPAIRTTAGQSNINIEGLKQITVPLPPTDIQAKFSDYIFQLRIIKAQARLSKNKIEKTFAILLNRAFSGELTARWREAHLKELIAEMEIQRRELDLTDAKAAKLF